MTAASFWSLLLPAIEMAQNMNSPNNHKMIGLLPVIIGFFLGAGFVYLTDILLPDNVTI
jgi:zinc transporter ZupT